jgi:hypothetical protein
LAGRQISFSNLDHVDPRFDGLTRLVEEAP